MTTLTYAASKVTVPPSCSRRTCRVAAASRRGARVKEILEDYPYLDAQDIEFAKQFVAAYPRVGRPRVREAPAR